VSSLPILARDRRLNIIDHVETYAETDGRSTPAGPFEREHVARLRADAREARRFILGDEASYEVGKWIAACEDLLLDNVQFAKAPFPTTYVEVSISEVNRGIGRKVAGPLETADDRLGYLIKGDHVRLVCSAMHVKGANPTTWNYWLNTPEDEPFLVPGHNRNEWLRVKLFLGTTALALKDDEQLVRFAYRIRVRNLLPEMVRQTRYWDHDAAKVKATIEHMVHCAAGELRTLLAVLLLINQHRHRLHFAEVGRHVSLVPQRKVYTGHTLVSLPIGLSREGTRKTFYPNTRHSPVGHDVRGHWMRFHLQEHCVHRFPDLPDDDGHFVCASCRGWRTWKRAHRRGDSSKGLNIQTYEVTP